MSLSVEKRTIIAMVKIYCNKNHVNDKLCTECTALLNYSFERLARCPFGQSKPACNKCKVHCYAKEKRDAMKTIMRFSGKHIFLKHPYLTTLHFIK